MAVNSELLEFVGWSFCPELQKRIAKWEPSQVEDLGVMLKDAVLGFLTSKNEISWWPKAVTKFFDEVGPAFEAEYMDWRYTAYKMFQVLTADQDAESKLGDACIQGRSTADWILCMTRKIASDAFRLSKPCIPQFDGSSDERLGSTSSTVVDLGSITQVNISGTTLKAAWNENRITQQLQHNCAGTH